MIAIIVSTDVSGRMVTYTYGGNTEQDFINRSQYIRRCKYPLKHKPEHFPIADYIKDIVAKEQKQKQCKSSGMEIGKTIAKVMDAPRYLK